MELYQCLAWPHHVLVNMATSSTRSPADLPNVDTLHHTLSKNYIHSQVSESCQVFQNSNFLLKLKFYH